MNYSAHYSLLIERARRRSLSEYTEIHHIIPKCIGGTNNIDNLVSLTPEEHFIAHQLLVKIYPNNPKLIYAALMMTVSSPTTTRNNKQYGWLKRRYLIECRKRVGKNNPSFGRPWYHDPVTLNSGKFSVDRVPNGWVKGRRPDKRKNHRTKGNKKDRKCDKCGNSICDRPAICRNGQRIKRFIRSFGFDTNTLGTIDFYKEYDRIVHELDTAYNIDLMSVEEIRIKYNIELNETVRCILRSLNINRRSLKESVNNYFDKSKTTGV